MRVEERPAVCLVISTWVQTWAPSTATDLVPSAEFCDAIRPRKWFLDCQGYPTHKLVQEDIPYVRLRKSDTRDKVLRPVRIGLGCWHRCWYNLDKLSTGTVWYITNTGTDKIFPAIASSLLGVVMDHTYVLQYISYIYSFVTKHNINKR